MTHTCGQALAKINGRTYKEAIEKSGSSIKLTAGQITEWVEVCPVCDAISLGAQLTHPYPFMCKDGVMRTVADFKNGKPSEYFMQFGTFKFTKKALESAIGIIKSNDTTTQPVEALGRVLLDNRTPENAYKFSEAVCEWGRGQRVWGNLNRFHKKSELSAQVLDWLSQVENMDDTQAIETGIKIKGLAVSFASKHLRLLNPERFAVLDEVLSLGLGYALNPAGYKLFIHTINAFISQHMMSVYTVAEIEFGIFLLVRQGVRSTD